MNSNDFRPDVRGPSVASRLGRVRPPVRAQHLAGEARRAQAGRQKVDRRALPTAVGLQIRVDRVQSDQLDGEVDRRVGQDVSRRQRSIRAEVRGHGLMLCGGRHTPDMDDPSDWLADAPLFAAWQRAVDADLASFTIPGHKRRAHELAPELGPFFDSDIPLYGGLDTVKLEGAVVPHAERAGARFWGGDWCRYSTGGSTHANQVAMLAVGQPGDTVLVARNAHRSTVTGLVLAGLTPVWLPSQIDERLGVPTGLDPAAVAAALDAHPAAKALFCVEPGYLGTHQRPGRDHRPGAQPRCPGGRRPGLGCTSRDPGRLPTPRDSARGRRDGHERSQDAGRLDPGVDHRRPRPSGSTGTGSSGPSRRACRAVHPAPSWPASTWRGPSWPARSVEIWSIG